MLLSKQQPVGQQAGATIQSAFGRNPCQLRKIIAFREMPENHEGGLAVILLLKKLGSRLVREMTHSRQHPLLDGPRIRPVAKHFEVVIRFQ